MTHDINRLAPMPDHNNTNDPLWLKLWHAYEPVITPLRRLPLVANVEAAGGEFGITVDLADGSHLWIASVTDLPLDPTELEGFQVVRQHQDNPTFHEVVYDSTQDGDQATNGNHVAPMLLAITAYVAERKLAPTLRDCMSVCLMGVTAHHRPEHRVLCLALTDRHEAVKQYGYETHALSENDWQCIHEQGGTDWPLTVWKRGDAVRTVYLRFDGLVPA
ncbi:hypothetical protein [Streptomyces spiramyceticus]|uniref:hypothetical protein n=1 Tax=Streptomyces spiramyceticus TaxID=299717 RepID=UPI00237C1787|nr:hypothetical protein [Streptomyces spiramyceticus]